MISKLLTPPSTEPISLRQAKLNLRLAVTAEDADAYIYENDFISQLITDAREYVEHYTDIRLGTQTWICYLDEWPTDGVFKLPESPVQAISTFTYNGIAFSDYTLGEDGIIYFEDLPSAELNDVDPIKITYTVGLTTIPAAANIAMNLIIGSGYNNREAVLVGTISSLLPLGVNAKLDTLRRFS